jgi:hypothetical protein
VRELLVLEVLLKLAAGLPLLLMPVAVVKLLGLPRSDNSGFWPRLLGAVLVAIAAACYLEARFPGSKGLALGGVILVNLSAAFAIAIMLAAGSAVESRRGRAGLWLAVALLVGLSLVEIAHA